MYLFLLVHQKTDFSLPFIYGKSFVIRVVSFFHEYLYTWSGSIFGLNNIIYQAAVQSPDFFEKETL